MTAYTGNHTNVAGRAVGRGNPGHADPVFKDTAPWMSQGLCYGSDTPDDWFEGEGDNDAAIKACRRCPVQLECLRHRIELQENAAPNEQVYGIWAGTESLKGPQYYARRLRSLERKRYEEGGEL